MNDPNAPISKFEHLVAEARAVHSHLLTKTRDYADAIAEQLGIKQQLTWGKLVAPPTFMQAGDEAYLSEDGWLTRALQVPVSDLVVSFVFSVKLHGHGQGHLARIEGLGAEYDMLPEQSRKLFYSDAVRHIERLLRKALGHPGS